MKLATLHDGTLAAVSGQTAFPLNKAGYNGNMKDLIKDTANKPELLNEIKEKILDIGKGINLTANSLRAPFRNPNKIVAVGLNYTEHAGESKMELPETPLVFSKFTSSITGPFDKIEIPVNITQSVDYEVELAVVIGKQAKNISKKDALEYVFGYTVLNDISARDVQFSESQWVRAKSFDTFCPFGPVIVTTDEIPDPQNLELGSDLNGKELQRDNTKNMVFGVADLISIISHSFKFEPGDIIATGTPSGVGFSRKPPVFLKKGDMLRSWITGIGEMRNTVSEV